MKKIHILDKETASLIAAGEVVERPFNVVKELLENSIDAKSSNITVEIKEGGLTFIRVTDNGEGIDKDDIKNAFLSHATSKISAPEDLNNIETLGFRGEALSSICSVSNCEVISKTADALTGIRYVNEGSEEKIFEEIGAPDGTTFIVRDLFFNVPARRKFLRSVKSEGARIGDLCEHIALSHPDIAFTFIMNGKTVFSTSGSGELKDVIYRIFGREVSDKLIFIKHDEPLISIYGYICKPEINKSNRSYESTFINGRYINCDVLLKAIEEGFSGFMMLHRFPFAVLHFNVDPSEIDVNIHPAKMEAKLRYKDEIFDVVAAAVKEALSHKELIPDVVLPVKNDKNENTAPDESADTPKAPEKRIPRAPEPFEFKRISLEKLFSPEKEEKEVKSSVIKNTEQIIPKDVSQINLFDEEFLTPEASDEYEILGQIFKTFWLIAFKDKLFIMDQHAAHEKVKYERLLAAYKERTIASQFLNPPIVCELTIKEMNAVKENLDKFKALGFEIEDFGTNSVALRAVPTDLFGLKEQGLFKEILDQMVNEPLKGDYDVCLSKLASMSCKAAVKGNNELTKDEVQKLLDELLTLDNPYNCPHGRPTIISMSKYEIERKFKRIVD